ncbi:uncharacterized protein LOC135848953 [Planococcus citri]|uniref:uncharacterized protein LOC135848953 n=1 Tax=Planococcus citri TaxID=170843 RepID=UPI0031F921AD
METADIDLEDKYTYLPPFPKLEDLAILTVSLDLWNYYYSHYHTDSCDDELDEVNEIINDMNMPNCIKEKIIELCETIDDELGFYHIVDEDIMRMCNSLRNKKHFFLYGAVWDTNGHIDHKKTAEKVLKCPERLNDNDLMFRIMAKYCLENCIKEFPLSSLSKQCRIRCGEGGGIINYWIEFKRNESKASDAYVILNSLIGDTHLSWSMYVYEYFWYFLDENQQVTVIKDLIEHVRSDKMFFLFSKLNMHQLRRLYLEEPAAIIINFYSDDIELINAAWARVRSTINEEQFEHLINEILYLEIYRRNDSNMQCLIDLWNSAPDNLINYLINVKNCAIIDYLLFSEKSGGCKFLQIRLFKSHSPSCNARIQKAILFG